MRICIITFRYKPTGGGIERYVDNLSKSLTKLNHDIDIITVSYDKEEKVDYKDRITIYRLPYLNTFGKSDKERLEDAEKFLIFLNEYLGRNDVDIIEVENMHAIVALAPHTLMINMMSVAKNIPIVLTIHSFPIEPYTQFTTSFAKDLLWSKIFPVSSAVAETFYNSGMEINKIQVINPGIDTEEFKPNLGRKWLRSRLGGIKERDIIILHASRISNIRTAEEKGIKTFLKAFSIVSEKYSNIKLLIAAAPPSPLNEKDHKNTVEQISDIAKLYKIKDKVKIASFQLEEMPLVYNGSDIFVMASRLESFGMVYAEAMACGLPVIGTSVGGIPEIIVNGRCGYLVPPDNPVELSKYLSILLADANKRKKFGSYGRKIVKSKFDINKISAKRIGHYKSLIHQKHKEKGLDIIRQIAKE